MFAGKMIQLGKELDIPVPVNETFFRIIRVIEEHYG
jgi:ketopantoate reductase